MRILFLGWSALLLFPQISWAENDPMSWLQKTASAAHRLNYDGTFIYQRGGRTETSRIVHLADEAGEHEKLESLDGPYSETIRHNDEIVSYFSENKSVIATRRKPGKSFPALLPKQFSGVGESYTVKLGEKERIAGHECQIILLEPRDAFRYGHRICADSMTGLPLRAAMLNEKNELVYQFTFAQITIGGVIDRGQFKPGPAARNASNTTSPPQAMPADAGWTVGQPPAGFKKIMGMKRTLPGKKSPVNHLVLSDDLVAVSVFIEPLTNVEKPLNGISGHGAVNVYGKPVAAHQVTVVGEVPAATVIQIGNSITYTGK